MKKKIIIALSAVLIAILAYAGYRITTTKSHSPSETKDHQFNDLSIKVVYCKPYKKGRLIFGDEKDGALVPYGTYWRLGANEATQITFNKNVLFSGKPVQAGTYRMYVVPHAASWQVSLNSELGKWGAFEPDYTKDVVKVEAAAEHNFTEEEQFTINFSNDSTAVHMDFVWDKTKVSVPIIPQ